MTFKAGDRVHLLETTGWVLDAGNPAIGTEWYCEGVVEKCHEDYVYVLWDNGFQNSYYISHGDLEHVCQEVLI